MDIPEYEFLQWAEIAAKNPKWNLKVECNIEAKYKEYAGGDTTLYNASQYDYGKRMGLPWTITNTKTGVSIQLFDSEEMIPEREAIEKFASIGLDPPSRVTEPVPHTDIDKFIAYAEEKGFKAKYIPATKDRLAHYEFKGKGLKWFKTTTIQMPTDPDDPTLGQARYNEIRMACEDLSIAFPPEIDPADPKDYVPVKDVEAALSASGREVKVEVDRSSGEMRFLPLIDYSVDGGDDGSVVIDNDNNTEAAVKPSEAIRVLNTLGGASVASYAVDIPGNPRRWMFLDPAPAAAPRRLGEGVEAALASVVANANEDSDLDAADIDQLVSELVRTRNSSRGDGVEKSQDDFIEEQEKSGRGSETEDPDDPDGKDKEELYGA